MASRKELKEQRRHERLAQEAAARQAERRRRRLQMIGAALALLVLAGGGAALALRGSGGGGDGLKSFAAKPNGLAQRVAAANLTPGNDHFHPTITVFVGDRRISVPDDVGGAGGTMESPIHRHAGDEQLHAEGVKAGSLTLGQFMTIWGVALSPTQLGPYRAGGGSTVRMWVKDRSAKRFRETRDFGRLKLRDGQQVYLFYGTRRQAPIAG